MSHPYICPYACLGKGRWEETHLFYHVAPREAVFISLSHPHQPGLRTWSDPGNICRAERYGNAGFRPDRVLREGLLLDRMT